MSSKHEYPCENAMWCDECLTALMTEPEVGASTFAWMEYSDELRAENERLRAQVEWWEQAHKVCCDGGQKTLAEVETLEAALHFAVRRHRTSCTCQACALVWFDKTLGRDKRA